MIVGVGVGVGAGGGVTDRNTLPSWVVPYFSNFSSYTKVDF